MTEPITTTTSAIAATPEGQTPPPTSPPSGPAGTEPRSRRLRVLSTVVFSTVALIGVLVVLYAWRLPPFTSAKQSTENAYVRGQVTIIGPQLSGYVFEVAVSDYEFVRAGQLLVRLDDRIYTQNLNKSLAALDEQKAALANNDQQARSAEATIVQRQAEVKSAEAQGVKAQADFKRSEALIGDGSISRSELDANRATDLQARASIAQARATLEIARQDLRTVQVNRASLEAQVASAQAAVELARIDLSNTRITAPRDGQLGQVSVRLGAYVSSGAQLMALVPEHPWVVANMKETQMANVKVGQPVTFTVDALNHKRLHGHVQHISPATGSEFSLVPADNATGNFVKIAQRISVRIEVEPDQPLAKELRPGMSVVVSIDTASH